MPCNMGTRMIFCAIFALKNLQRQITNSAQVVSCNIPAANVFFGQRLLITLFAAPAALKIALCNTAVANRFRIHINGCLFLVFVLRKLPLPFSNFVEALYKKFPGQLASDGITSHSTDNLDHVLWTNLSAIQRVLQQP